MTFIPLYKSRNIGETLSDTLRFLTQNALPLWVGITGLYALLYGLDFVIQHILNTISPKSEESSLLAYEVFRIYSFVWGIIRMIILTCVIYNYVVPKTTDEIFKDDDYSFLKINAQDCFRIFKFSFVEIFIMVIINACSLFFYWNYVPFNSNRDFIHEILLIGGGEMFGKLIFLPLWGLGTGLILINQYDNIKETLSDSFNLVAGYRWHFIIGTLVIYSFYLLGNYASLYLIKAEIMPFRYIIEGLLFVFVTVFIHTLSIFVYGSAIHTNAEIVSPDNEALEDLIDSLGN